MYSTLATFPPPQIKAVLIISRNSSRCKTRVSPPPGRFERRRLPGGPALTTPSANLAPLACSRPLTFPRAEKHSCWGAAHKKKEALLAGYTKSRSHHCLKQKYTKDIVFFKVFVSPLLNFNIIGLLLYMRIWGFLLKYKNTEIETRPLVPHSWPNLFCRKHFYIPERSPGPALKSAPDTTGSKFQLPYKTIII